MTQAHQNGEVNLANKNRLFGGWFGLSELKQKLFRGWFNVTRRTATKYVGVVVPLREWDLEVEDRELNPLVPLRIFETEALDRDTAVAVPIRVLNTEVQ